MGESSALWVAVRRNGLLSFEEDDVRKELFLLLFLAALLPAQEIAWWKVPLPVAPALAPNVPGFSFGDQQEAGVMVALVGLSAQVEAASYKIILRYEREGVEGVATVYSDYRTCIFWIGKVTVRSVKVDVLAKILTVQKDE
jgi:hypothetical protein